MQARGANILAEYLGGAITCDAYHMTDPRADGLGVSTCIELALKDANIEKEQVSTYSGPDVEGFLTVGTSFWASTILQEIETKACIYKKPALLFNPSRSCSIVS